ncbi:MAG: hypothetical protein HIU90_16765 [Proteobacteria bacterium]|nr:hypothetical protein [Pseudomonadota bacterium]
MEAKRRASCYCGQLIVERTGEPIRVCPDCGSTVYWNHAGADKFVAVTIGAFADPSFSPPIFSVYAERRHAWVSLPSSVVET